MEVEYGQIGMLNQRASEYKGGRSKNGRLQSIAKGDRTRIVQVRVIKVAEHYLRTLVNAYYNPAPWTKHYGSETLKEMRQGSG
jgi:hypothetical protein